MKKRGEENECENDKGKLRDTKRARGVISFFILNERFMQAGGWYPEPSLLLELATLLIYMLIGQE